MNKQNLRPCMGGWLLLASGALSIFRTLISLMINVVIRGMPLRYLQQMLGYSFLPNIIYALPLIIIGIMLVMKKQGIPVAIACGVGVVAELLYPILAQLLGRVFGLAVYVSFGFGNILNCLPYVLLALLALTTASPQPNGFKQLWWLPAAVSGLAQLFDLVTSIIRMIGYINFRNLVNLALPTLFGIVAVVGFFFAGQWLFDPYRKQPAYRPIPPRPQPNYYPQPQYQQPQYTPVPPQPAQPQPVQPQPAAANSLVQELERAKHLLDSGAITQEEYDVLKKRLLN